MDDQPGDKGPRSCPPQWAESQRRHDTIEKFKINVFLFLFFKLFLKIESSGKPF